MIPLLLIVILYNSLVIDCDLKLFPCHWLWSKRIPLSLIMILNYSLFIYCDSKLLLCHWFWFKIIPLLLIVIQRLTYPWEHWDRSAAQQLQRKSPRWSSKPGREQVCNGQNKYVCETLSLVVILCYSFLSSFTVCYPLWVCLSITTYTMWSILYFRIIQRSTIFAFNDDVDNTSCQNWP